MDAIDCIMTRRSVRKFKSEKISEDKIKILLEAAMNAPSAVRSEDWEFIVIDERKTLDRISELNPYAKYAKEAPLAILVCGNLSKEKIKGFWQQNCAAAMENLLLAAHASGLGAVWTGVHPMENIESAYRNLLSLPDNIVPMSLAIIGVPDQRILKEDRFKKEKVHRNKW